MDTPFALAEADRWLADQPRAVGGIASQIFYDQAARLKDFAISREFSIELLHKYNPGYDTDDIGNRVDNAWKHGQNEPGCDRPKSHEEVFANLKPLEPIDPLSVVRGFDWWIEQDFPPIEWIMAGFIAEHNANLITGKSKVGKTTFLLNLIVHMLSGRDFLGCKTKIRPVVAILAEDKYGQLRDHLVAICNELGIDRAILRNLFLRSVIDEPIEDGYLVRVSDEGIVVPGRYMTEGLGPTLAALDHPLCIFDPITELIAFNRYAEMSARRMVTGFCNSVCRLGKGVTLLLTDHPSIAGVKNGRDVAGSVQMEASFPIVNTLKAGDWEGTLERQRKMSFETKFNRHAPEQAPKTFWRVAGTYAVSGQPLPGTSDQERHIAIYRYLLQQYDQGVYYAKDLHNKKAYQLWEMANDLQRPVEDVRTSIDALEKLGWLRYEKVPGGRDGVSCYKLGPKGPPPSIFDPPAPEQIVPNALTIGASDRP